MIEDAHGNLLQAEAEALINTVNCVGVMGKGIALQFKQAYPEMAKAYEKACERGAVKLGTVQVWETGEFHGPKYVINFPTKDNWINRSSYASIESGLQSLIAEVQRLNIRSIAVPPLGCGNGGLSWAKVRPMILRAFEMLQDVHVLLYAPAGAPPTAARVVNTEHPKLTRARALFIAVINRYSVLAYQSTLLEIQKLAYFLQEAGEPLRLQVRKAPYGPYAENLNKVLETLEGHYIHGFDGERNPQKEISLADRAAEESAAFLSSHPDALERLNRVGRLIEGFETPYGMELLSSVHYVATHEQPAAASADDAIRLVHAWIDRKKETFKPEHIRIAWDHLHAEGWLRQARPNP